MKKIKAVLIYVVIGFTISMAMLAYSKLTHFEPMEKISIDADKVNASESLSVYLQKEGCYEVGLSSYESIFRSYKIDGKYKLQYYYKDELLEEKIIKKNLTSSIFTKTDYTAISLDVIEVPHKGHSRLTIKLTVLEPEKMFENNQTDVYLYVDKTHMQCGEKLAIEQERSRIKKLTIDIPESNETLKELSEALWKLDTVKIKQLIPSQFDVNVSMIAQHTPLHYSAYLNDEKTAKYLIQNGVNMEAVDIQDKTPLYYAIENNSTKIVRLLLDSGADIKSVKMKKRSYERTESSYTTPPLFYATCSGMYELTEILLNDNHVDNNQISRRRNVSAHLSFCFINFNKTERKKEIEKMRAFLKNYGIEAIWEHKTVQFQKEKR